VSVVQMCECASMKLVFVVFLSAIVGVTFIETMAPIPVETALLRNRRLDVMFEYQIQWWKSLDCV